MLLVLISLAAPMSAFADDETPPAETPVETETPPETESTPAASEPAPETETVESESTPESEAQPEEEVNLPEVLEQTPDGTEVVVLDEQGETLPLASQDAAEILVAGDPMWCPAGVLPGGTGCTGSFTTFTGAGGLLAALAAAPSTYSGNGVIYVAETYDSSLEAGDILIDGSVLVSLEDLVVQGGWDFGLNTVTGASLFDGLSLQIDNWLYDVTVNDIEITDATLTGLSVSTTGDIVLSDVNLLENTGSGAYLASGSGSISVTGNSTFNANGFDGLQIQTSGDVTLNGVVAGGNGGSGVYISGCGCLATLISIANGDFSSNGEFGLAVHALGNVSLTQVAANDNGQDGISILNGSTSPVTLSEVAAFDNGGSGIDILTDGDISLSGIDAGFNGLNGASLQTSGQVTVADAWLGFNEDQGLQIESFGSTTLNQIAAFDNQDIGALVFSVGTLTVTDSFFGNCFLSSSLCGDQAVGGLFFAGSSILMENTVFQGNQDLGMLAFSPGPVKLINVFAEGNGYMGAGVISGSNVTICGGSYSYNGELGLGIDAAGTVGISSDTLLEGNGIADTDILAAGIAEDIHCGGNKIGGSSGPGYKIVPVAGGEDVPLDCTSFTGSVLVLPNGDRVILPCPINETAILDKLVEDGLLDQLGDGSIFLSAMDIRVLRAGEPVDTVDGSLTVSFILPAGEGDLAILWWDGSEWVDLGAVTGAGRVVSDAGHVTAEGYFEAAVNFTGTFVLVRN